MTVEETFDLVISAANFCPFCAAKMQIVKVSLDEENKPCEPYEIKDCPNGHCSFFTVSFDPNEGFYLDVELGDDYLADLNKAKE